ncbi:MAG TPA: pilus assembly protein [Bosea sp. (in: a-proteobacteria)]|jgi:Flp pilus assembly protein TadG|uniref:vWA domain-containing protein n=1 Tax=Bosea sp. (in: a-proteobacteria) TaxID=1871050 RepID=UPI002E0EBE44|nr:pilus assembly protein [Bosea sp. (in: a-proteobacteria)]
MSLLSRFGKDASGNVGIMFGFLALPMIGIAGASIDYARATSARSTLNAAVDSAALMVARDATRLTDAQLRIRAEALIRANLAGNSDAKLGTYTVAIDRTARTVNVTATTAVETSLTKVIGVDTIPVSSTAQSAWGTNTVELALVLDNTGSMASSSKLTELKKASLDLLKILKEASTATDQIRVSVVPFATQVRLPTSYKDSPWLRYDMTKTTGSGSSKKTVSITKATWEGCVSDRDKPYDVSDAGAVTGQNATLFPADFCAQSTLTPIRPLTSDWTALTSTINAMTPVGNTNVTIGAAWGAASLSPGAPLPEAAPATTPRLTKYMILLTDGDNTQNRFGDGQSTMDQRTEAACTSAKADRIKIYSIRVIDGNRNLLRGCASDTGMYYEVSNASQLTPIFQQIAREISQIRLTM